MKEELGFTLNRRNFLKGSALGALGVAGFGLVSCSSGGNTTTATKADTSGNTESDIWTLDSVGEASETASYDLAIIGGGGTGMAAAIQAKQLGLNPILVEKMGSLGGAYICTEGMAAFGSDLQKAAGINIPIESAIDMAMEFHHWITDRKLYEAFFDISGETVSWCQDLGIEYSGVTTLGPDSLEDWHIWHHIEGRSPGVHPVEVFSENLDSLGVDIILNASAKKILVDQGKVSGVLVEQNDGSILEIETKAVILASGGFGQNEDMLRELGQSRNSVWELGVPGRDGDGLRMGKDAGADTWDFQTVPFSGPVIAGAPWAVPTWCIPVQPLLWVNQDAQRFAREDIFHESFAYAGNLCKAQEKTFTLLTEKDFEAFETVGPYCTVFTLAYENKPMPNIKQEILDIGDSLGHVYSADSIESLAQQIGLDSSALAATVKRYNEMCANGADEDFAKDSKYMISLSEGPYYALECSVGALSTAGGLRITEHMECLAPDYSVVPGLYAGGCDAGGLFGDTYDPNCVPGSQAGWAVCSGRIAAISAAEYLGK